MRDPRAELVRIDSHGQAHPIGSVSSHWLRAREGTYRLLPAPNHVVFMRVAGRDAPSEESTGAVVRLAGEITAPGALCDVVALLGQAAWRGELCVYDGDDIRSVFFSDGNVLGAQTSVLDERIGAILYKFGVIDEAQRDKVLSLQGSGKRFGELVLELGFLNQQELYQFMQRQMEQILYSALTLESGTFFFLQGFDESRLVLRHTVSASSLLMDAVTRMDEMRFFRQKVPSADHVPVRAEGHAAPEEFERVFSVIDSRRSVGEIGRMTGIGEFEATKAVYSLVQNHHVTVHPPAAGPQAVVMAANAALVSIFDAAGQAGQVASLRDSLASFAVMAGVYDILLRDAGPDATGTLDVRKVVENVALIAVGTDPVQVLRQMLHEYVSFAVFCAGAALGSRFEGELLRNVGPLLAQIRPVG
ncbi:MAG TPA: DUF4388 domain-containing protein [Polyangiaceae bacterium]|nr:DUF4388 domain-containing protein [Polyangiaceae bacterium]